VFANIALISYKVQVQRNRLQCYPGLVSLKSDLLLMDLHLTMDLVVMNHFDPQMCNNYKHDCGSQIKKNLNRNDYDIIIPL